MNFMAILGAILLFAAMIVPFAYADNVETDGDQSLTPAFQTIEGTLEQIDGNVYVVAQYITDYRGEEVKEKEMSVYVSSETKLVHGVKNVGDPVRIEVTSRGVANSIE
jgi:hypothetical protein